MERFTPTFQTPNNDASLGDTGTASASFWKVGNVLYVQGVFNPNGAGVSAGTGDLLLPFPPGITSSNVDVTRMPLIEDIVGPPHLVEAAITVHVQGIIAAVTGAFAATWLLVKNVTDVPATVVVDAWQQDISGLIAGNVIFFDYAVPLL
jgi:hypothetical protein